MQDYIREQLLRKAISDLAARGAAQNTQDTQPPLLGIPEQVDMIGGIKEFESVPPWLLQNLTPAGQYLQSLEGLQNVNPSLTLHKLMMGKGGVLGDVAQNITDIFGVTPPGALETALLKAPMLGMAAMIGKGKIPGKVAQAAEEIPIPKGDPTKVAPKVIETATGPRLQADVDAEQVDLIRQGMAKRQKPAEYDKDLEDFNRLFERVD